MNIQGNALQSQLKAFTVLQPVFLELDGASLGPSQWQGAAFDGPTRLNVTIRKCEYEINSSLVVQYWINRLEQ